MQDDIEEANFERFNLENKSELVLHGADFEKRPSVFVDLDS